MDAAGPAQDGLMPRQCSTVLTFPHRSAGSVQGGPAKDRSCVHEHAVDTVRDAASPVRDAAGPVQLAPAPAPGLKPELSVAHSRFLTASQGSFEAREARFRAESVPMSALWIQFWTLRTVHGRHSNGRIHLIHLRHHDLI